MRRVETVCAASLSLALLAGCVHSTRVEVHRAEGGRELSLVKRWHGIVIGTCGFVAGTRPCDIQNGDYVNASIRLNGPGPYYRASEVELRLLNARGEHEPYRGATEGGVQFDETRRAVTIGLGANQGGRMFPLGINGTYEYRER